MEEFTNFLTLTFLFQEKGVMAKFSRLWGVTVAIMTLLLIWMPCWKSKNPPDLGNFTFVLKSTIDWHNKMKTHHGSCQCQGKYTEVVQLFCNRSMNYELWSFFPSLFTKRTRAFITRCLYVYFLPHFWRPKELVKFWPSICLCFWNKTLIIIIITLSTLSILERVIMARPWYSIIFFLNFYSILTEDGSVFVSEH